MYLFYLSRWWWWWWQDGLLLHICVCVSLLAIHCSDVIQGWDILRTISCSDACWFDQRPSQGYHFFSSFQLLLHRTGREDRGFPPVW